MSTLYIDLVYRECSGQQYCHYQWLLSEFQNHGVLLIWDVCILIEVKGHPEHHNSPEFKTVHPKQESLLYFWQFEGSCDRWSAEVEAHYVTSRENLLDGTLGVDCSPLTLSPLASFSLVWERRPLLWHHQERQRLQSGSRFPQEGNIRPSDFFHHVRWEVWHLFE